MTDVIMKAFTNHACASFLDNVIVDLAACKYHDEQKTVCGVSFVGFNIPCILQPQALFLLVSK